MCMVEWKPECVSHIIIEMSCVGGLLNNQRNSHWQKHLKYDFWYDTVKISVTPSSSSSPLLAKAFLFVLFFLICLKRSHSVKCLLLYFHKPLQSGWVNCWLKLQSNSFLTATSRNCTLLYNSQFLAGCWRHICCRHCRLLTDLDSMLYILFRLPERQAGVQMQLSCTGAKLPLNDSSAQKKDYNLHKRNGVCWILLTVFFLTPWQLSETITGIMLAREMIRSREQGADCYGDNI